MNDPEPTGEVTLNYFEICGFFHYKDEDSIEPLREWLSENSVEYAWGLEMEEEYRKKHIQFCMRRLEPLSKNAKKVFCEGAYKKYLIDLEDIEKTKNAKRYSFQKTRHEWNSSLRYVFKFKNPEEYNIRHGWSKGPITKELYQYKPEKPKTKEDKTENTKKKTQSFAQEMLNLWEKEKKPRGIRENFKMLLRHACELRWNYIDVHMLKRAATWLAFQAEAETGETTVYDQLLAQFDQL